MKPFCQPLVNKTKALESKKVSTALKGDCTIFGKIDMFLKTFRLLVFAISNLDIRPYKDF